MIIYQCFLKQTNVPPPIQGEALVDINDKLSCMPQSEPRTEIQGGLATSLTQRNDKLIGQ